MATLEQMAAKAHSFVTQAGVEYKLPRLSVRTRRAALDFVRQSSEMEQSEAPQVEIAEGLLNILVDLLRLWLAGTYPDITTEQIEEDWDVTDVPGLMTIIKGNESEIEAALPPASPAKRTTSPTGRRNK